MKSKKIVAALAAAGMIAGFGTAAHANDAERIARLEAQLKLQQQQIDALLAASAGVKAEVKDVKDQMAVAVKENVVVGDIPGSFRIPGSDTSIRVYGFAELNMVRESRGDNSANDYSTFMPYMPLNGSDLANRKGQTYLHARTSRIGFEGATPSPYGQLSVKLEGDFNNDPRTGNSAVFGSLGNIYTQQAINSYNFRLRHAYGQVGPWLFGQTWSTFMDIDNTPETVDFNGPIGSTFIRQPMIRYTYATPQYGNFIAAIENSVSYALDNTGSATTDGFSRAPDFVARWDKAYNWGSLSLRGVSHEHRINDGAGVNLSRRGSGLAASGQIKSVGDDFFSWIVTGGTGIGRYFNYIEGAAYGGNRIVMEKAVGLVLGYQRKFSNTFRMNFVYGMQKNSENEYTAWARTVGADSSSGALGLGDYALNRKVSQFHIGGIWNPVKVVDIGAELVLGQRETLAGEKGRMNRINLSGKYNFN